MINSIHISISGKINQKKTFLTRQKGLVSPILYCLVRKVFWLIFLEISIWNRLFRTMWYFLKCNLQITNGTPEPPAPGPIAASRPPSSVGPNSLLSTPGLGRKKPLKNNSIIGDGWQTVGTVQRNKFQMKRVKRKYIEVGTSVICIHTKVRIINVFVIEKKNIRGRIKNHVIL